jgi:hypothetical protein
VRETFKPMTLVNIRLNGSDPSSRNVRLVAARLT